MKSIFIYFLPVIFIACCFRILDSYYENTFQKKLPLQQSELIIKSDAPINSSANINEVNITINLPVIKKFFFALHGKSNFYLPLSLTEYSFIRLSARIICYQSLFLSHHLLQV